MAKSGDEIYHELSAGNAGNVQSAIGALKEMKGSLDNRSGEIMKLLDGMAEQWQGAASDAAQAEGRPVASELANRASALDFGVQAVSNQQDAFGVAKSKVKPVPSKPTSADLAGHLPGLQSQNMSPVKGNAPQSIDQAMMSPVAKTIAHQQAAHHNIQVYKEYHGLSGYNKRSTPDYHVFDMLPDSGGSGSGGGAPIHHGGPAGPGYSGAPSVGGGGATAPAGVGGGHLFTPSAVPQGGGSAPVSGGAGSAGAGVPHGGAPAAPAAGSPSGYPTATSPAGSPGHVQPGSPAATAAPGAGGYPGGGGDRGAATGVRPGYAGEAGYPATGGSLPYEPYGGESVGGPSGPGGHVTGGYESGGRPGGGYAEGGYGSGRGSGGYGANGYAEGGGFGRGGASSGASPRGGAGKAGPRGDGARSGVGRDLSEHPFGDPALPPEERYHAGSAARGGGMAPMMGGAGAGGGRDGERQRPGYLRGHYLPSSDEFEYDSNGVMILPPGGFIDPAEFRGDPPNQG
jgi:uncharacterized protein YukE